MSEIRKVGRPKVGATPVTVRIPPDVLAMLDEFASQEPDTPSRPEALRRILRDWLVNRGYMKAKLNNE